MHETVTNVTSNASDFRVLGPEYHRQVRVYILSVMIAVSCVGNTATCLHIIHKRRRRSRIHLLFLNLACADLLVTCFAMVSQLVWETMERAWVAGDPFCRLFKVLQTFTMVSSNYMLLAIALDRHAAVVYPLSRHPRTKLLISGAWTISLVPSLPNAYIFQVVTVTGRTFCVAKFYTSSLPLLARQLYMAFVFFTVFLLPISLIVGLYARILYVLRTRSRQKLNSSGTFTCLPRAKVKTLRMTLVVVLTFLATCLPYLVQEMIIAFGDPSSLREEVVALSGIVSASNSCLNPYIYILFNSKAHAAKVLANALCRTCVPSPEQGNSRGVISSV